MAVIRPFAAIRPCDEKAHRIAALPYDVYNRQEAKAAVEGKPLSFLRIDRAETAFPDSVDWCNRMWHYGCLCRLIPFLRKSLNYFI